jgi:sulfate adenylyltransferase subunit 1 (EFTu-like GTPase family)
MKDLSCRIDYLFCPISALIGSEIIYAGYHERWYGIPAKVYLNAANRAAASTKDHGLFFMPIIMFFIFNRYPQA